jgi:RHS repeat-associated protein
LANYDYDEAGSAAAIGTLRNTWGARLLSNSGRRNRLIESGTSSGTIDYDYDNLNRLAKEAVGSDYLQYDSGAGYESTGYDSVGNRRSRTRPAGSTRYPNSLYGTSATTNYAYDQNDRLDNDTSATSASTLFDGNGNTTTFIGVTYAYDFENRLLTSSAGSVTMTYDGDGNRVKKVSSSGTTFYLIDDRNPTGYAQALEEQATTAASAPSVTYVYGLQRINQKRATGTYYYGHDGLGTVRYLTTKTVSGFTDGAVSDTYNYDGYGVKLPSSTGSTPNNYLFAAEYVDTDLSMSYNRARFYHLDTGRFWTVDTFEGSQSDPLSLHKYLYAHDNPVNRIDPSGYSDSLIGQLSTMAIRAGMFTVQWATRNPRKAFVLVSALSATGAFDGFPPGHPTPFDELATFGRVIRGTGRVAMDTAAIARYQGALSIRTFFSKFFRKNYTKTYFEVFSHLEGKVVVHHAVPQHALIKYPGVITEQEMHSLANLRGIPKELNPEVHLSRINTLWKEFFDTHPTATKSELLDFAKKIDDIFGDQFEPPVR